MIRWVSAVSYGPLYGGRNAGLLAFTVDFSGAEPDSASGEMAETLMLLRNYKSAEPRWLYLRGAFPTNELFLHSFCKAARDSGFWTFVETDGQLWRPWFTPDLVNHLIVVNDGRPWMQFRCQEFRLHWDGETPPPSEVPPELATTQFVLVPMPGVALEKTLDFLRRAKGVWSLALWPKNAFRINLLGGTDAR